MCGIVYAHNTDKTPVNNDVLNIFDAQRGRGLQGFGLFDGQEGNIVREVREDGILKWLVKYDSDMILFHHRMPTSTENVRRAAHPFATKKYFGKNQYILVHNGHINNSSELKKAHETEGIDYQSITSDGRFNDSESLLWDLALTLEGRQEGLKAKGGIAFICIKLVKGKPSSLFFGRNYNPLKMEKTDKGVRLSSEGKGEAIESHKLYELDYKTNKVTMKDFTISSGYASTNYSSGTNHINWNHQNNYYRQSAPALKAKNSVPGDWLPDYLQKRYGRFFDNIRRPIGDDSFLDYDRDGNPIFPSDYDDEYESYDDYVAKRRAREFVPIIGSAVARSKEEVVKMIEPETEEVEKMVFDYLTEAEGNFGNAYELAEGDYETLFDIPEEEQDFEYLQYVVNIEKVLEEINTNVEYVDENSICSSFNPCQQRLLTV